MVDQISDLGFSELESVTLNPQVEELTRRVEEEELSLGVQFLKAFDFVEKGSERKTKEAIDELEKLEGNLDKTVRFLSRIEQQLASFNGVAMTTQEDLDLMADMRALLPGCQLLDKPTWTKEEATSIQQSLNRCSQLTLQQIHQAAARVNRSIEEGTELLQIARKVLDMLHQLHQTFTSNQRSR